MGETKDIKLYINDEEITVRYDGSSSNYVSLEEGENLFTVRAVNGYGKSESVTKKIKLMTKVQSEEPDAV